MNSTQIQKDYSKAVESLFNGVLLLVIAGIAFGLIALFGKQFRLGKLIGIVVACGAIGVGFILKGIFQFIAIKAGPSTPAPAGSEFQRLMGRHRDDAEVTSLMSRLRNLRASAPEPTGELKFTSTRDNAALRFDGNGNLVRVTLGGPGIRKPYRGVLPYSLSSTDTAHAVIQKLRPHAKGDSPWEKILEYPALSLKVVFHYDRGHVEFECVELTK